MINKEAYYFSHDSNARNDEKLLAVRMRFGAEGYGIYFMIIERLRDESDNMSIKDYNILAFDFRVSADKVKSVIEDFELFEFTDDKKYFYSQRMLNNMKIKNQKSEKARLSAEKRWNKSESNANAMRTHSEGNAIKESKVKESKVKEINDVLPSDDEKENPEISIEKNPETSPKKRNDKVEKLDFQLLLEYLNEKTGRNYRVVPDKVKTKFHSLLKQGYEKKDIKTAIDNAVKAKNHIENNFQYLTMEFFSRTEKIDMYSNTGKSETVKSKNNKPLGVWSV